MTGAFFDGIPVSGFFTAPALSGAAVLSNAFMQLTGSLSIKALPSQPARSFGRQLI
jgi:hypothetical protein